MMRDQLTANGREVSLEPFADWTDARGFALRDELLQELGIDGVGP